MRLKILKARDDGIKKVFEEAHKRLITLTKDKNAYKHLLKDLIVQVFFFPFFSTNLYLNLRFNNFIRV